MSSVDTIYNTVMIHEIIVLGLEPLELVATSHLLQDTVRSPFLT